ncbi:hypothetical protein ABZ914_06575, partial [Spirillospora sp. NPDC046719]
MNEIDLVREALGRPRPTEQETAAALAQVRRDIAGGAAPRRPRGLAAGRRRRWGGGVGRTPLAAGAGGAVAGRGGSPADGPPPT